MYTLYRGEAGHVQGYGLEIAVQFISDLYGGVFSGGSTIVSVLEGLEQHPEHVVNMVTELTQTGAGSLDTVTYENIYKNKTLLVAIVQGMRRRFPVPLLSRKVAKQGLVVEGTALPVGMCL